MSGLGGWWERKRRMRVDDTSKQLLGPDGLKIAGADDLQAQQFQVGVAVRQWYDAGYDRIALIQNLLVAACFIADNHGVSRDQMMKVIAAIEMKTERQLVFDPK